MLVEHRAGRLAVDPAVVEPLGEAHRGSPRTGRRRCATTARPTPARARHAAPRRAGGRSARSTDRACRGCRRGRADGRPRRRPSSTPRRSSYVSNSVRVTRVSPGLEAAVKARSRGCRLPVRSPDEQQAPVRDRRDLLAQVLLHLVGETAAGERVARPEAAVLDEEPVVDPARGCGERLVVLAREVRAEGPRLRQPSSCVTRQITWPGRHRLARLDGEAGDGAARGEVISFSIFIASTTQTTWPAATSSPSLTSTARTVPCMGVTIASRAAPWWPLLRVPVAAAAGELGVRWLRRQDLHLEAPALRPRPRCCARALARPTAATLVVR